LTMEAAWGLWEIREGEVQVARKEVFLMIGKVERRLQRVMHKASELL